MLVGKNISKLGQKWTPGCLKSLRQHVKKNSYWDGTAKPWNHWFPVF